MKNVRFMTLTALLTAIAIFIAIAMPLKLVIPPASYTLGSHVAIFIAMFINPWMAIFVVLGSSYGLSSVHCRILSLRHLGPFSYKSIQRRLKIVKHHGFSTSSLRLFTQSVKYWHVCSSTRFQGQIFKACFTSSSS